MASNSNGGGGANPSDIMAMVEAMKALQALGGLQGANYLQLGQNEKGIQIPTPAARGMSGNELGFAPQGLIFTGGSPYKPDNRGKDIQSGLFLLDQLLKSGLFGNLSGKGGKPPAQNSVMANQPGYGYAGGFDPLAGLR